MIFKCQQAIYMEAIASKSKLYIERLIKHVGQAWVNKSFAALSAWSFVFNLLS